MMLEKVKNDIRDFFSSIPIDPEARKVGNQHQMKCKDAFMIIYLKNNEKTISLKEIKKQMVQTLKNMNMDNVILTMNNALINEKFIKVILKFRKGSFLNPYHYLPVVEVINKFDSIIDGLKSDILKKPGMKELEWYTVIFFPKMNIWFTHSAALIDLLEYNYRFGNEDDFISIYGTYFYMPQIELASVKKEKMIFFGSNEGNVPLDSIITRENQSIDNVTCDNAKERYHTIMKNTMKTRLNLINSFKLMEKEGYTLLLPNVLLGILFTMFLFNRSPIEIVAAVLIYSILINFGHVIIPRFLKILDHPSTVIFSFLTYSSQVLIGIILGLKIFDICSNRMVTLMILGIDVCLYFSLNIMAVKSDSWDPKKFIGTRDNTEKSAFKQMKARKYFYSGFFSTIFFNLITYTLFFFLYIDLFSNASVIDFGYIILVISFFISLFLNIFFGALILSKTWYYYTFFIYTYLMPILVGDIFILGAIISNYFAI